MELLSGLEIGGNMAYIVYGLRPVDFKFKISAPFDEERSELASKLELKNRRHKGIDFACPILTPVKCYLKGKVQIVSEEGPYGNHVWVYHDLPNQKLAIRSCYAHLASIHVKIGQDVEQGTLIGLSGATGKVTGPHLHFETRCLLEDVAFAPKFFAKV